MGNGREGAEAALGSEPLRATLLSAALVLLMLLRGAGAPDLGWA